MRERDRAIAQRRDRFRSEWRAGVTTWLRERGGSATTPTPCAVSLPAMAQPDTSVARAIEESLQLDVGEVSEAHTHVGRNQDRVTPRGSPEPNSVVVATRPSFRTHGDRFDGPVCVVPSVDPLPLHDCLPLHLLCLLIPASLYQGRRARLGRCTSHHSILERVDQKLLGRVHSSYPANPPGVASPLAEAPPGFEPGIEDLQSSALPLGHGAEIPLKGR